MTRIILSDVRESSGSIFSPRYRYFSAAFFNYISSHPNYWIDIERDYSLTLHFVMEETFLLLKTEEDEMNYSRFLLEWDT